MNERIRELAKQARQIGEYGNYGQIQLSTQQFEQKFAELIVRECACLSYLDDSGNPEVEEALEFWRKNMLKHFGVEE